MSPRKTATLFIVCLSQPREGKAAPYRNEWREMALEGGARIKLPPGGLLEDRRLWLGVNGRIWHCCGISASSQAGAPCVAITPPKPLDLLSGDSLTMRVGLEASPSGGDFGIWSLIDNGELTRHYHLMIAALPPVWKVKKAPRP